MGKHKQIPDRWLNYTPMGKPIPGTRFIAFKVPLRKRVCDKVDNPSITLHSEKLLDCIPNLGLVIDLTNTTRYYDPVYFSKNRVEYKKIACPGGNITPSSAITNKFNRYVKRYLDENRHNDKLIGVHCTHGVNRTGYLICSYMVINLNMDPIYAIANFEKARGHNIERLNYRNGILALKMMFRRESSRRTESTEKEDERFYGRQRRRSRETSLERIYNSNPDKKTKLHKESNDQNFSVMPNLLKWSVEKYHNEHKSDRYENVYSRSHIETETSISNRRIPSPVKSADREYNRIEKSDFHRPGRQKEAYESSNGQWYVDTNNPRKSIYRFHDNEHSTHHSTERLQEFQPTVAKDKYHVPENPFRNSGRPNDYREIHRNIEGQYRTDPVMNTNRRENEFDEIHSRNRTNRFPLFRTPDSAKQVRYHPKSYDNMRNKNQGNFNTYRRQNDVSTQQRFPKLPNWRTERNEMNPSTPVPKLHPYDSKFQKDITQNTCLFPRWVAARNANNKKD